MYNQFPPATPGGLSAINGTGPNLPTAAHFNPASGVAAEALWKQVCRVNSALGVCTVMADSQSHMERFDNPRNSSPLQMSLPDNPTERAYGTPQHRTHATMDNQACLMQTRLVFA